MNGVLVTEILTGITSDTAPVDNEPLIIGELPNLTISEDDIHNPFQRRLTAENGHGC